MKPKKGTTISSAFKRAQQDALSALQLAKLASKQAFYAAEEAAKKATA